MGRRLAEPSSPQNKTLEGNQFVEGLHGTNDTKLCKRHREHDSSPGMLDEFFVKTENNFTAHFSSQLTNSHYQQSVFYLAWQRKLYNLCLVINYIGAF